MFGEMSMALGSLDDSDRKSLALLLEKRNEYIEQLIKLNRLRINALVNPSQAAEEAVSDFNSAVVAPLRDAMTQDAAALMESAISVEGMKQMLPMVVAAMLGSVNVTLLMTTLGLEPDTIKKLSDMISEYVKSGM